MATVGGETVSIRRLAESRLAATERTGAMNEDDGVVRVGDTWRVGESDNNVDVEIDAVRSDDMLPRQWVALGLDRGGRRYGFLLSNDHRLLNSSGMILISRAKPQEPAEPAFDAHDAKRVVRVGDVLATEDAKSGRRVERIEDGGAWFDSSASRYSDGPFLSSDGTLKDPHLWRFMTAPQRCGLETGR